MRINDEPFPLLPEQFDYALRKKGVEKMIVIVRVPPPLTHCACPTPSVPSSHARPCSSSSRLLSRLWLRNAKVNAPWIRALLETARHFCEVFVLGLRTASTSSNDTLKRHPQTSSHNLTRLTNVLSGNPTSFPSSSPVPHPLFHAPAGYRSSPF